MTDLALVEDTETMNGMTKQEAFKILLADVNKPELEKVCKQLYLSMAAGAQAYMAFKAVMQPVKKDLVDALKENCEQLEYSDLEFFRFALSDYYSIPDLSADTVGDLMRFASTANLSVSKITGIK